MCDLVLSKLQASGRFTRPFFFTEVDCHGPSLPYSTLDPYQHDAQQLMKGQVKSYLVPETCSVTWFLEQQGGFVGEHDAGIWGPIIEDTDMTIFEWKHLQQPVKARAPISEADFVKIMTPPNIVQQAQLLLIIHLMALIYFLISFSCCSFYSISTSCDDNVSLCNV